MAKISPMLSKLLSDLVYKEEEIEMSPEEASLLQEEIANASEQIESDTTDLALVSNSLDRTLEITKDIETAIDTDTIDKHTASLLLSEFASIYKDTMGQEFTYSKNLSDNPLEIKQTLTAGLQSANSFLVTLKKIIRKIWESLGKAIKWLNSKIKLFLFWLYQTFNKVFRIKTKNAYTTMFEETARNTYETSKDEIHELCRSDEAKHSYDFAEIDFRQKKIVADFKKEMNSLANKFSIFNNGYSVDEYLKENPIYTSTDWLLNYILNISVVSELASKIIHKRMEIDEDIDRSLALLLLMDRLTIIDRTSDKLVDKMNDWRIENIEDTLKSDQPSQYLDEKYNNTKDSILEIVKNKKEIIVSVINQDLDRYVGENILKLMEPINNIYADILSIFKMGHPKYDTDTFSRMNMHEIKFQSKAAVVTGILENNQGGVFDIEISNIFAKKTYRAEISFLKAGKNGISDSYGPNEIFGKVKDSGYIKKKYKEEKEKIRESMDVFSKASDEVEKFLDYIGSISVDEMRMDIKVLKPLISISEMLNNISPAKMVKLHSKMADCYMTIMNDLDFQEIVKEAFRTIEREAKGNNKQMI